jgi:serine/threonine protein kinase
MTDELATLVGSTLDQRYKVIREIGRGAMGTVYEARHPVIGRRFALKVLRRSCGTAAQRERFLHEARAAGAISHPNIVSVQDFGIAPDGAPYLVMEYVDGTDLQSHLEKLGSLPTDEALEICAQMLSALEVIHGAGLVHRDIKPANIMLARGSRARVFAKLLDFGIARAINPAWQRPDLTRVDQVLGTPAYLSPEQAAGDQADPRWDLWALATILYELLCGKLPFRLESLEQVTDDIINCRLVPLQTLRADLPRWVYQVLDRAHHPQLGQRFPTATAFLQALEMHSARPEGDEGADARTVPFMRVQLQTPPPQLVREIVGVDGYPTVARGDRTLPDPVTAPQPKAVYSDRTDSTVPVGPEQLVDEQPADAVEAVPAGEPAQGPVPDGARPRKHSIGPEPARRLHGEQRERVRRERLLWSAVVLLVAAAAVLAYLILTRR